MPTNSEPTDIVCNYFKVGDGAHPLTQQPT